MAVYRAQISFQADSALPQDAITINPHFVGSDPAGLAAALKTNLLAVVNIGPTWPFRIKVYDAEKAPPSYPLAEESNGTGFTATGYPRELALCLSYYSTWNRPSYRGRLYIPLFITPGTIGLRPTQNQMDAVLTFANTFKNGMPPATNWVVWSTKLGKASGVTDIWCDNEWDIQRSRGLKGTTRAAALFAP